MSERKHPEYDDPFTEGMYPVQFFSSEAIMLPPGTPARPRADRPPYREANAPEEAVAPSTPDQAADRHASEAEPDIKN